MPIGVRLKVLHLSFGRRMRQYRDMAASAPFRLAHHKLVLAMDYGQFIVNGGQGQSDELDLLERAQATPPSSSDGRTVLILSPHQNNFAMEVDVEVWDEPATQDREDWQQVSEDRIVVDSRGLLFLGSPTMDGVTCTVPPGEYLLEVSGRGFITTGWPGSTQPGDAWRLRLWPTGGESPQEPKVWSLA